MTKQDQGRKCSAWEDFEFGPGPLGLVLRSWSFGPGPSAQVLWSRSIGPGPLVLVLWSWSWSFGPGPGPMVDLHTKSGSSTMSGTGLKVPGGWVVGGGGGGLEQF